MKSKITKLLLLFSFTICINNTMNAQTIEKVTLKALNSHQQNLAALSALTASGNTEELKIVFNACLDGGLAINEIKEALVQLYAYCGFPRSLNALGVFKTVLDERATKGIKDKEGKAIVVENTTSDKYEQGRKVLERLTQTPQKKPAPGFGEFAPRADSFLKEHLFADIFGSDVLSYSQRELVTISALAAMPGVEPQLKAHIGMGKNTGITDDQLKELTLIIDQYISRVQGNVLRKCIGEKEQPLLANDMMVRISEIEIIPEFLEQYRTILKEEAAASVNIEPGVVAIFPMFQREAPNQVRIVEIYAEKSAYEHHLATPQFKKYKETTLKMVKSLKLVDMDVLDTQTMVAIFGKLKNIKMEDKNKIPFISEFPTGNENTDFARYFIGKSYVAPLTSHKELNVPIANVTFEPGCRNNWHSHSGGQILIVVGGEGLYQERGKKPRHIRVGDIVEIGPNVEHWHGATANSWFSHLAIMCNPQANENKWLEPVSEDVYKEAN
ncbi:carboxymuconolactone decarboxylase family protein [Chitinophaga sancti]|uniref:Cupin domain protein n=2 Tax=Chitinophaga sancti TaxID=1004 RepID=A0A1K1R4L2_9BACT|nr:carboxymuconolactone decarboxylase family protein [Chitinophaga sancti]WQD64309.1 carboxymuconolactone decarboxylase family protein [Chitinophaga sancti]SFW66550.1 Cupin domain protein [Chitinophaga sancti]